MVSESSVKTLFSWEGASGQVGFEIQMEECSTHLDLSWDVWFGHMGNCALDRQLPGTSVASLVTEGTRNAQE